MQARYYLHVRCRVVVIDFPFTDSTLPRYKSHVLALCGERHVEHVRSAWLSHCTLLRHANARYSSPKEFSITCNLLVLVSQPQYHSFFSRSCQLQGTCKAISIPSLVAFHFPKRRQAVCHYYAVAMPLVIIKTLSHVAAHQ